jgi:hypothetical protein
MRIELKNKIHTLTFTLLVFTFAFAGPLQASDYYVDQNHPKASDLNPGTEDLPWKTITKANQVLTSGDTVHIKAGTYTTYIAPSSSGTSDSSRITYRNFGTDTVTIRDAKYGIYLDGNDYITVQGIDYYNLDAFLWLRNSANHNIITYCNFDQSRNTGWSGSKIYRNSCYNTVSHCSLTHYGYCTDDDTGSILDIGNENVNDDVSNYNLIEHNIMAYGGHHVLGVYGEYNVVRNNYLHNDAWYEGYGNRTLYMNGYTATAKRNLIENNRFGYAAAPCDAKGVGGVSMATSYNIFRYNKLYHHNLYGLGLACYSNSDSSYNKIYHNTFFNNAYDPDPYYGTQYRCAIHFSDWTSSETKHNVIKNNLYYSHERVYGVNGASLNDQTFANNFEGDTQGDPKFVNASKTPPADKTDSTLPDLNLQPDSPAIEAAGYLTTITSASGSGTSFIVDDAGYFMDGWGIIQGDNIQLEGTTQRARITGVNYQSNTVTVDKSLTWTLNQGISLTYEGTAPDAGAYEVSQGYAPSTPQNLRIVN